MSQQTSFGFSSERCFESRRTPTVSPESRCGISQAAHTRVPESILFLRSDHESKITAQTYMVSHELKVLYVTARALRLSVTSEREGGCRLLIEALILNSCPLGAAPLNWKFWSGGKGKNLHNEEILAKTNMKLAGLRL